MFLQKTICSILLIALLSTQAFGAIPQDESVTSSRFQVYRSDEFAAVKPQGWWLFLGLSNGLLDYTGAIKFTGGSQVHVKVGGTYFFEESYNLDAFMGISANHVEKTNSNTNNLTGVFESNLKFEINPYFDIGPSILSLLGNGDQLNSSLDSITSFVGIGFFKDFVIEDKNIFRIGLRMLTDLSAQSGSMQVYLLDFQLGLPFKTRADVASNQIPVPIEAVRHSMKVKVLDKIRLSERVVSPNAIEDQKLHILAAELSRNPTLVDKVEIVTPGLSRGKNLKDSKVQRILYEYRAQHMESIFRRYGVERSKIVTRHGLDSSDEISIRFIGINDAESLSELLARSGWNN